MSSDNNKRDHETMTAAASAATPMTKVLIYGGKTGWIGGMMHDLCVEKGTWYKVRYA